VGVGDATAAASGLVGPAGECVAGGAAYAFGSQAPLVPYQREPVAWAVQRAEGVGLVSLPPRAVGGSALVTGAEECGELECG
jgi:hypothetical protein